MHAHVPQDQLHSFDEPSPTLYTGLLEVGFSPITMLWITLIQIFYHDYKHSISPKMGRKNLENRFTNKNSMA